MSNETSDARRLPTYFVSHGGGPWPWMKDELHGAYDRLEASLYEMREELGPKPAAIVIVSGHWEERDFTVMAGERPEMIYDYGGFPAHTYRVRYPAPGSPDVAERVRELLDGEGLRVDVTRSRGFDHGVFVPLAVAFPDANVPVVQLSIRSDYDPETHFAAGRALAPLRDENVLVLASGLSYHNLRRFGPDARVPSHEFDAWLTDALRDDTGEARRRALAAWSAAPSARAAHPREDHLVPLFVAVGAADGESATRVYHEDDFFGGIAVSSFRFGPAQSNISS